MCILVVGLTIYKVIAIYDLSVFIVYEVSKTKELQIKARKKEEIHLSMFLIYKDKNRTQYEICVQYQYCVLFFDLQVTSNFQILEWILLNLISDIESKRPVGFKVCKVRSKFNFQ